MQKVMTIAIMTMMMSIILKKNNDRSLFVKSAFRLFLTSTCLDTYVRGVGGGEGKLKVFIIALPMY